MRFLLDLLYLVGLLLASPWFIFKMATAGKYRRGLAQRLGRISAPPGTGPVIWVHAVSVGELQVARPLIAALCERHPGWRIVISHTTRTGEDIAAQIYPGLHRVYAPLDFSFCVARFFRVLQPAAIVLIELELWPNFLLAARKRKAPVILANGRIGQRSALGYGRNAWFFKRPFSAISRALMQNEEYAGRLAGLYERMSLDTSTIHVSGNMKFDNAAPGLDLTLREEYRELFGLKDHETLLVCGSTHPGEHEALIDIYRRIHAWNPKLRMLVAPRHPERWQSVRELFGRAGIPLTDRSSLGPARASAATGKRPLPPFEGLGIAPVILLDSMGELSKVYHAADIAFVGGSLIPHGGQNMIEPAALGLPVLFGTHTHNFRAAVRDLLDAGGGVEVKDAEELHDRIKELVDDSAKRTLLGEKAAAIVQGGRGAVVRHVAAIEQTLHGIR